MLNLLLNIKFVTEHKSVIFFLPIFMDSLDLIYEALG